MKNRRDFLKSGILAGTVGILPTTNVLAAATHENEPQQPINDVITILQTTDVHCQINPHDELFFENKELTFRKAGGYAHIMSLFNKYRKANPNTITIDTGDMFQGSELSDHTRGDAFTPILNKLNYDLYTPGNWEVIFYKSKMQKLLGALKAPKVCANMYHAKADGTPGELIFQPYQIIQKLGIKIGFLGYTDHLVPNRQPPALSQGIAYTKPEDNLQEYVKILKDQEQCDFIIILSHCGLSQQLAIANNPHCEGVDYILGGDTHERVRKPIQCKYAKVVEPGAFGSFVGKLDLKIKDGKIVSDSYELIEVNPNKYKADPSMAALLKEIEKPYVAQMNKVVGQSTVPLYRNFVVENTMDTMIIDALKWKTGVDLAVSNGFRFCPPRLPDTSGLVQITESYVYDMLPINAPIRVGKVKGSLIKPWIERELENVFAKDASKRFGGWLVKIRGLELQFKAFVPKEQKIEILTIDGEPIDVNKYYTLCACEREGDPEDVLCRLKGIEDAHTLPYTLHDALKAYLKEFSPVTPTPKGTYKVTDADPKMLSQVWGIDYEFV